MPSSIPAEAEVGNGAGLSLAIELGLGLSLGLAWQFVKKMCIKKYTTVLKKKKRVLTGTVPVNNSLLTGTGPCQ